MDQEWEGGLTVNPIKNEEEKKMEKLLKLLKGVRADVDFEKETNLIDGGVLDSMDIVQIAAEICEQFNVELDVEDLDSENFNSADAMWKLIQDLT